MPESVANIFIAMFAVYGFYMALYEIKQLIVRMYFRRKHQWNIDKHGKI